MIEALLGEVGKRLSDRWLIRALGPGLLWCAAVLLAAHSLDDAPAAVHAASDELDKLLGHAGPAVVWAVVAVLSAALAALAASALGSAFRFAWLGRWPGVLGRLGATLTARRRRRAVGRLAASGRVLPEVYLPARPTWIGDRIRLADDRVTAQYRLRLALIWTRLWLLLDADARAQVTNARDRFERAGALAGWAVLYLALSPWWWPALPVALVLAATGWWRARGSAALFADVVEATVDLHHRRLVAELGFPIEAGRALEASVADAVNDQLHKGASGYPQETAAGAVSPETSTSPSALASVSRDRRQGRESRVNRSEGSRTTST
jgi:hypothetical protein